MWLIPSLICLGGTAVLIFFLLGPLWDWMWRLIHATDPWTLVLIALTASGVIGYFGWEVTHEY